MNLSIRSGHVEGSRDLSFASICRSGLSLLDLCMRKLA